MTIDQQQPHLWQDVHSNLVFADLCNALYERELKKLATEHNQPAQVLLKRIGSLPYYIKRASERILANTTPLDLDSQNASWLYRQPTHCPGPKQNQPDIEAFYHKHAKHGLVVPIYHYKFGEEHLTLDTIDGVDSAKQRIHSNENGWFGLDGQPQQDDNQHSKLLKPTKLTMSGACSGHKWLNDKRNNSRALSLREMLLATNINWKNFTKML
ncbi:MAG: hypothetical protein ACI8WB_002584 [Phenylobacterium sp.]|jgi:hypothetical protein